MRKVVVFYKDAMDHYTTEYKTGPYTGDYASDVMRNLRLMGCEDLRVEPYKGDEPATTAFKSSKAA